MQPRSDATSADRPWRRRRRYKEEKEKEHYFDEAPAAAVSEIDPADLSPADASSMFDDAHEFEVHNFPAVPAPEPVPAADAIVPADVPAEIDLRDVPDPNAFVSAAHDEIDLDDVLRDSASSNGQCPPLSPKDKARLRAKRIEVLRRLTPEGRLG